jgi:hypothetical protein
MSKRGRVLGPREHSMTQRRDRKNLRPTGEAAVGCPACGLFWQIRTRRLPQLVVFGLSPLVQPLEGSIGWVIQRLPACPRAGVDQALGAMGCLRSRRDTRPQRRALASPIDTPLTLGA